VRHGEIAEQRAGHELIEDGFAPLHRSRSRTPYEVVAARESRAAQRADQPADDQARAEREPAGARRRPLNCRQ
jgi:hypothetical protein